MSDEPQPHNCNLQGEEMCCYCWASPAKWRREYEGAPGEDHICDACKEYCPSVDARDFKLHEAH